MYEDMLRAQIVLCHYVQEKFNFAEPLWVLLSEQLSVPKIMDVFVPVVGVFHHQLLVRLVCSLGVINALTSLMKWCSPEHRPYWWMREMEKQQNLSSFNLRQHPVTCETSAGFPSSHAMCCTTFIYVLSIFALPSILDHFQWGKRYSNKIGFVFVAVASFAMWLSRFYLATQFLHHCFITSLVAIALLNFLEKHAHYLSTLSRCKAVAGVLVFAYLPVAMYFVYTRHADLDPHWSVRMAFKWCKDPGYLRHEASPVFILSRDFGFLTGIALSAPLHKRYACKMPLQKRTILIFVLESVNYYARLETPKDKGRLIFVGYECIRNLLHSYSLLTIIPSLSQNSSKDFPLKAVKQYKK